MGFIVTCTQKTSVLTHHQQPELLPTFAVALLKPEAYRNTQQKTAPAAVGGIKQEVLQRAYLRYQMWNEQLMQLSHWVEALLSAEPHVSSLSSVFVEPLRHQCHHWKQTPGALFYPLETDLMVLQLQDSLLLPLTFETDALALNQQSAIPFALLQQDLKQLHQWYQQLQQRLKYIGSTLRFKQVEQANQQAAQLGHVNPDVLRQVACVNNATR